MYELWWRVQEYRAVLGVVAAAVVGVGVWMVWPLAFGPDVDLDPLPAPAGEQAASQPRFVPGPQPDGPTISEVEADPDSRAAAELVLDVGPQIVRIERDCGSAQVCRTQLEALRDGVISQLEDLDLDPGRETSWSVEVEEEIDAALLAPAAPRPGPALPPNPARSPQP